MIFTRTERALQEMSALWKLCLSLRKRDWNLEDYPLAIREQDVDPDASPRRMVPRYAASIVRWHLTGTGDTKEEAFENLRKNFETAKVSRRNNGLPLFRPGTRVPITFATQEQVYKHPELTEDFIQRVLELDWAWISDESSLWEFHTDETNEQLQAKIKETYGVDVSDLESAKIWEILDRIASSRAP